MLGGDFQEEMVENGQDLGEYDLNDYGQDEYEFE
jgi:hypothetical protein